MDRAVDCVLAPFSRSTRRWITVGFGSVLMLCGGTIYLLPAWGDGLRAQARLNVSEFNTIATCMNAGTPTPFLRKRVDSVLCAVCCVLPLPLSCRVGIYLLFLLQYHLSPPVNTYSIPCAS